MFATTVGDGTVALRENREPREIFRTVKRVSGVLEGSGRIVLSWVCKSEEVDRVRHENTGVEVILRAIEGRAEARIELQSCIGHQTQLNL